MHLIDLAEQLADQFEDIAYTEAQLMIAVPKMARTTSTSELRDTFGTHLSETKRRIARLVALVRRLDIQSSAEQEARAIMVRYPNRPASETALKSVARRIEHFEKAANQYVSQFTAILTDHCRS